MKKIVEFFDRLEERMENVWENKNRMKKGMGVYTGRKIAGAFAIVEMDLLVLIFWITGVDLLADYRFMIAVMIIGFIASQICCHYLNKRIKAQETEEAAEDLEDDIADTAFMIAIIGVIAPFVFAFLVSKDARQDLVQWIQDW